MKMGKEEIIIKAYQAFNKRNIDAVLSLMAKDVHWPNGWEGGYVEGDKAVKDYWTRQWKEVDPYVTPVAIKILEDDKVEVEVHQVIKDKTGNLLSDGE